MKALLLLCLLFISCTNVDEIKYAPQEVITKDTLTKLVNNARVDNSLNELKSESLLIELSKVKAIQMESEQSINHNGFSSLQVQTETYAQIVGFGYKTELSLFNAYYNSLSHRQEILGNFTHIGSYTFNGYNCVIFAKY